MPKIKLQKGEYYPFYGIPEDSEIVTTREVDLSEEQLARWLKIFADLKTIQAEFAELWGSKE